MILASAGTGASAVAVTRRWQFLAALLASTALALALRLVLRVDHAGEVDSVRFARALVSFDVAAYRPHFPGYPVFVLLGKALQAIVGDPVQALALLGAVSGGLLPLAVALFLRPLAGEQVALLASVLVALDPLLLLYSEKLLSDMTGLLFLFSGLATLAPSLAGERHERWLAAGGFLLGLMLGVRLSYFPFVLSAVGIALWQHRPTVRLLLALGAGLSCGAVPLILLTGLPKILELGLVQGLGHFTRWGGTVVTEPVLTSRLGVLFHQLFGLGLALTSPERGGLALLPLAGLLTLGVLAMLAPGSGRRDDRPPPRVPPPAAVYWAVWVLPYLVWVFLGQNIVEKPRHALPLLVFLLGLVALLAVRALTSGRTWQRGLAAAAVLLWAGGLTVTAIRLGRHHQETPSSPVRLARAVEEICVRARGDGRGSVVVYTAGLQDHLADQASCPEVVVARRLTEVRRDLVRRATSTLALVASDVARVERLRRPPIQRFARIPGVESARSDLALYAMPTPGEDHAQE